MRRFVFVLQGLMPVESINWIKYPTLEQEYLIPGEFCIVRTRMYIFILGHMRN